MIKRIKNFCFISILILLLVGCKSIVVLPTNKPVSNVSINGLIDKINANSLNFKNIKARIRARYDDGKNKEQVIVQLRIKSNEIIWLSATMLVPIAKAVIIPNKLRFYEKFQKTYFEGDINSFNSLLNNKLDFKQIQNLLLGRAVADLEKSSWKQISNSKHYIIVSQGRKNLFNPTLFFNPINFLLEEQRIFLPNISEVLRIQYANYIKIEDNNIPQTIRISLIHEGGLKSLVIDFTNIDFPTRLTFPFEIPAGYKKLEL